MSKSKIRGINTSKFKTKKSATKAEVTAPEATNEIAIMPSLKCISCVHHAKGFCNYWQKSVNPNYNTCIKLRELDDEIKTYLATLHIELWGMNAA